MARIHEYPRVRKAVAVHLAFNGTGYVVQAQTLARSMERARVMALKLIDVADREHSILERHATLTPITEREAMEIRSRNGIHKELWHSAIHDSDHMTRVNALIELARLSGVMPKDSD